MTERRCILSGERTDPENLIRLAISPDGEVLPDVRARAPGRGAWLGVGRAELEQAIDKGRFKGALGRAFKGEALSFSADLPERIETALRTDVLARMGLEAKASNILTGHEKIGEAARKGSVRMLLHASDAGSDGSRKLDQAWRVGEEREGEDFAGMTLPVDREALSMALGRNNVVHVAVTNAGAAKRLNALLARWQSYLGCAKAAPDSIAVGDPAGCTYIEEGPPEAAE